MAEHDPLSSFDEIGRLLIEGRRRIDSAERRWLERLAEFDERAGWQVDGHLSAVSWLVDRCGLSRPAAKERLRVAHELRRRPMLAEALGCGTVSYSKVRALTRIRHATPETDEALLAAAQAATAADLDRLVQHWQVLELQERPLEATERWERRGVRCYRRYDGLEVIGIVLPPEDAERLLRVLDAYLEHLCRTADGEPVDPAEAPSEVPPLPPTWAQRRADALVDLLEEAVAHLDDHAVLDTDRVSIDVVLDYDVLLRQAGRIEIAGGPPLGGEEARRLACDAGVHRIIVKGRSEILDIGRRTRQWSRAQRRAIRFRFGGRCAMRGCDRRIVQIHHTTPWAVEGRTDLDAGVPLCSGHHRLVHEGGWTISYDPHSDTTRLLGPQGQQLVSTARPERTPLAA